MLVRTSSVDARVITYDWGCTGRAEKMACHSQSSNRPTSCMSLEQWALLELMPFPKPVICMESGGVTMDQD